MKIVVLECAFQTEGAAKNHSGDVKGHNKETKLPITWPLHIIYRLGHKARLHANSDENQACSITPHKFTINFIKRQVSEPVRTQNR